MTDCACVYIPEGDACEVFYSEVVTARKRHNCDECRGLIRKGDKFKVIHSRAEGIPFTHRVCADCLSLIDVFFCRGWAMDSLWEDFGEHVFNCSGQVLNKLDELTPGAKAKVLEEVQRQYEILDEFHGDNDDDGDGKEVSP